MEEYMERLCVFICMSDLLANFLPSPKYEKLYRHVTGGLILLLLLQPLGKETAVFWTEDGSDLTQILDARLEKQTEWWNVRSDAEEIKKQTEQSIESCLEELTEQEIEEELTGYGYEITTEDEQNQTEQD
jgi:hypothetical protein